MPEELQEQAVAQLARPTVEEEYAAMGIAPGDLQRYWEDQDHDD